MNPLNKHFFKVLLADIQSFTGHTVYTINDTGGFHRNAFFKRYDGSLTTRAMDSLNKAVYRPLHQVIEEPVANILTGGLRK